ncbi:response regulator receiver domain-containing protein [Humitalea rosea]|uniref:Response regulator receiver domain-containing protein n=1 Tax=Humitalea rosea TaxID=990373 RepID=A0A2W7IIT8_9PROT|nr:response regulator [Humitalea rosea]PZW46800.1 response regulator receiver domain-containing protein [Humitalea rosea]
MADPHAVLLLEDHALLRATLVMALRHGGFTVYPAGNISEALALLVDQPAINVVLSEVELGVSALDGFTFAAMATALRAELGFVFLTGRDDLLLSRTARGREIHLVKPCPMTRVEDSIRQLMAPGLARRA